MMLTWLCALALGAGTTQPAKTSPAQWRAQQRAAAEKSEKILREAEKVRGLLGQYQVMQAAYLQDNSTAFRLIFGQYLSWHQTYLGLYAEARKSFSIAQEPSPEDAPPPLDHGYKPQAAIEAIPRLAKDARAVFLNEAHNAPVTRSLTVPLLARLRAEGFDTFAAETLYETDKDLQQRGYPTVDSGFYTQEPVYGEMVRTALRLGYKVIAYEAVSDATGDAREREQARLLYERSLKKDPKARLVVNAGYGHIVEGGAYLGGRSMAQHFREIAGVDPLTVEQTMLIEHGLAAEDHPYYRAAVEAAHVDKPTVFVDAVGKAWSLRPKGYDISVLFPPEQLVEGKRPAWLTLDGQRQPYAVAGDLCRGELPCMIEARYLAESEAAVPADRIVFGLLDPRLGLRERARIRAAEMHSELYLRPGRYRLTVSNADNQTIATQKIAVTEPGGATP